MLGMPDQITFFMAFLMLCFAGLLVMFYFVLRAVDDLAKVIRVERSAVVSSLREVEASMQRLEQVVTALANSRTAPQASKADAAGAGTADLTRKEERLKFSQDIFSEITGQQEPKDGSLDLLSMSSEQQSAAGTNGKVLRLDGIEPLLLK